MLYRYIFMMIVIIMGFAVLYWLGYEQGRQTGYELGYSDCEDDTEEARIAEDEARVNDMYELYVLKGGEADNE